MKAAIAAHPGGPEVLSIGILDTPVAGDGEVLIAVSATAVNRADLMQRAGQYSSPPGASSVLGLECSGRIAAIGSGVTGWQVGDEVCALLAGGGYAEFAVAPATQLMRIPAGVDLVTAAALPEVSCTVWSMVFDNAKLGPGETFLVHGGSSGIGTMAIQLAVAIGAEVFATAGTRAKLDFCTDLGASVAINYSESDFAEVLSAHTAGVGVDVILDTVGAKYLDQNVRSLAVAGRLAVIGMLGGTTANLNLATLMLKRGLIYAAALRVRPLDQKAAIVAGTEAHVWPLIAGGQVRPIVHAVFPLADAAKAHELVASSEHIGKVVLAVA